MTRNPQPAATRRRLPRSGAWALSAVLAAAAFAADFETAGPVPAASFLPKAELAGPDWKVAPQALNDGVYNNYTVESRFGSFAARGRAAVAIRAKEVTALAELERISKSDVFVDAAKKSALGSVRSVASFAARPAETLRAVPTSVGRWMRKTKYQVQETYVEGKETATEVVRGSEGEGGGGGGTAELVDEGKKAASAYALDYLRISSAERAWYAQLGVDPYTDNEVLREVIRSYAQVGGLASFGMKFVGLPSIPGAGELRKTMDLVWKTDPWELRLQNRQQLLAAGISEQVARDFENQPHLSLTQQTALVGALGELAGVTGREHLLARALDVDSREEGADLTLSVLVLTAHQRAHPKSFAAILPGSRIPVARTAQGGLVAVAMAESVRWTEDVAGGAREFAGTYEGDRATSREVWTPGEVSDRFAKELASLGWKVVERRGGAAG